MRLESDKTLDCIVIGGGFSGRTVLNELSSVSMAVCGVDLPSSNAKPMTVSSDSYPPIEYLVNATRRPGGGTSVWGGGLSFPRSGHFLSGGTNPAWDEIIYQSSRTESSGATRSAFRRRISPSARLVSRWLRWKFRNLDIDVDIHGYSGGRFGLREETCVTASQIKLVEGSVEDIRAGDRPGTYVVCVVADQGMRSELITKTLVLAAGAIGNAQLTGMLTNQRRFPCGNHFATVVARIFLRNPRLCSGLIQAWTPDEKNFSTLSLGQMTRRNRFQSHSSLRVHPVCTPQLTEELTERWLSLRNHPSRETLVGVLWTSLDWIYFKVRRRRLSYALDLKLILDIPPQSGSLEFIARDEVRMSFIIDENSLQEALELITRCTHSVASWENVKSVQPFPLDQVGMLMSSDWLMELGLSDSAHYYGTVPVTEKETAERIPSSVDERFELSGFPGVFVVGGSSIPVGHHGHPTLVISKLANALARYLTRQSAPDQ